MNTTNDVYVISLDAVDLNFLPISQTHRDGGAVPLWSNSNLDSRRNEYYEFVIKSDDAKDQNEPVIENITCHMCDINVPKGYFNEHKNGFRHKFNRKVADTALKRLQLYVNRDDVNEFNEKLPSKHFCTECSIVIDSEDETSHKQTTGHRNSLFLERFLKDFLHFYINDDNEIRKDTKTEIIKESQKYEQDVVSDELNVTETELANIRKESIKNEDAKDTNGVENYKTPLNSDGLNNNLRPSLDLQDKDAFLEVVDGPYINKFRVTEMCYDAIVVTGATSEYCMICNQMFVRENRLLHMDSKLHGQNLRQKSLDKNCVRKINSTHHHCALCNDYFTEYDLHVNSTDHLTNYRNKIMYKRKKTVQDNDNSDEDKEYEISRRYNEVLNSDENRSSTGTNKDTAPVNKGTRNSPVPSASSSVIMNSKQYCDTCNRWLSKKRFHRHLNRKKHIYNVIMSNNNYLLNSLDKEKAFCKICQVTVLTLPKYFYNHFTSSYHINEYTKLLKAQNITRIDGEKYYCWACKVKILHKNELVHIESREHADNVGFSESDEIDEQRDDVTGSADGDATDDLVDSNAVGGESGNANDNVQVNANNGTALETVNQLDCNSLNLNPQNTLSEKLESIFLKYLSKIESSNDGEIDSNDNDSEIDETPKHIKKKAKRDLNTHFCNTCEVQVVVNNPNSIADHNKSAKHMRKLKLYHVVNGALVKKITNLHYHMKTTATLNVVQCIVCNTDLEYSERNVFTHIKGEDHKTAIVKVANQRGQKADKLELLFEKITRQDLVESKLDIEVHREDPNLPLNSVKTFEALHLKPNLLKGVYAMGFYVPLKIQEIALPILLADPPQNMIAQSQPGAGKTTAFVLAMLSRVDSTKNYPQVLCLSLCLSPAYELAVQTAEVAAEMARFCPEIKLKCVIKGEVPKNTKITDHILIGTPLKMLRWAFKFGMFDLNKIKVFVLNEADVMIDRSGHRHQCIRIYKRLPPTCQTILSFGTYVGGATKFINIVPKPIIIRLLREEEVLNNIKQYYIKCKSPEEKYRAICIIYGVITIGQAIIFCQTKKTASWLSEKMSIDGHSVAVLSGELKFEQKLAVIDSFRRGIEKVLITTNVLLRGIHFQRVTLVVNFDMPVAMKEKADCETYLYAIGRTGRFGKAGIAINLIDSPQAMDICLQIEAQFGKKIQLLDIQDAEEIDKIGAYNALNPY